jgi:hypothetical protein
MTNKTSSSHQIGPKLLELLGLPSDMCRSATIRLVAGEAVTIEAEYYAEMQLEPNMQEPEMVMRRFKLVERGESEYD